MNKKINEIIRANPDIAQIFPNLEAQANQHPEWEKITDYPPFSIFRPIILQGPELKKICQHMTSEINEQTEKFMRSVAESEGKQLFYVINLIKEFARYKCAAEKLNQLLNKK